MSDSRVPSIIPGTIGQRELDPNQQLFTWSLADERIYPRYYLGHPSLVTQVANTEYLGGGEYQFTENNELDYSSSVTDAMAAGVLTFTELPSITRKIHVYCDLRDTGNAVYLGWKRTSGGTQEYFILGSFADVGTNQVRGTYWMPTSGNSIYVTGVAADTTSTFKIIGYKVRM